jgi:endonuclease/exonuclease/phosphatase family metal-dependent hydrolase
VPAELVHADLERNPGAGRRPLEDERDRLAVERSRGPAVSPQLMRPVEERAQLLARKLLSGEEMPAHPGIVVRVLSWNLFHGRDFPPEAALRRWRSRLFRITERDATHAQVNAPLRDAFADWLSGREWDLALLQEAPPRWLRPLADRTRASGALALTSRNFLPALRALLADWSPDLIASNEGGSNQLLARAPARIVEVRRLTLTWRPERRRLLWARVVTPEGASLAVANLHASAGDPPSASREVEDAAEHAVDWAAGDPLLFGGDLNLRPRSDGQLFRRLRERYGLAPPTAPGAIDHVLTRGFDVIEPPSALPAEAREVPAPGGLRLRLSDHAPVVASLRMR